MANPNRPITEVQKSAEEQRFDDWRSHPETKAFFAWIKRQREQIRQDWEAGAFAEGRENSQAIGICQGLRMAEEVEFSQINETGDSDE